MALSEVFWGLVMTTSSGIIILAIKSCLKANIDDLSLCFGLFRVHRVIRLDDVPSGNDSDEGSGGSLRLTPTSKPAELKI
jgi:hypothetical protein